MTGFVEALGMVLQGQITKYVVLGDSTHGLKSLKCLAAAVKDGQLKPLAKYNVSTVLIEGPSRGDELSYEHGAYAKAVKVLAKNDVRVVGCEDAQSTRTLPALDALFTQSGKYDPQEWTALHNDLLNQRIPDANGSWLAQALKVKPKVIICCGTSHLPDYTDPKHGDVGLIRRLHQRGMCYGFAVEPSNTGDPFWYEPEKGKGFGRVECIDPYAGWEAI